MASRVVMHMDIETQEMVNHSRVMFLTTIMVVNIHYALQSKHMDNLYDNWWS